MSGGNYPARGREIRITPGKGRQGRAVVHVLHPKGISFGGADKLLNSALSLTNSPDHIIFRFLVGRKSGVFKAFFGSVLSVRYLFAKVRE